MGYEGYLLKIGDYIIPHSFISASTYQVTRSGQDLDSLRSEEGELHRGALDHFIPKVEFETPPMITDDKMQEILKKIRDNYVDVTEQKALARIYLPMVGEYVEHYVYLPDVTFRLYSATKNEIKYEKVRIAFIGY